MFSIAKGFCTSLLKYKPNSRCMLGQNGMRLNINIKFLSFNFKKHLRRPQHSILSYILLGSALLYANRSEKTACFSDKVIEWAHSEIIESNIP